MHTAIRLGVSAVAAATTLGLAAGPAFAGHDSNPSKKVASYSYGLDTIQDTTEVPGTDATGSTRIKALPKGKLLVTVKASGLTPNQPHAMHLHGVTDGTDLGCPGPGADANGDGVVTVREGVPFYGGILASLTTSGDTSPGSGLALDRMPVADEDGNLFYERTFRNASAYAEAGMVQVVVHGADFDGNGAYAFNEDDYFAAMESSIAPGVPLEATVPVLCGGIAN